MSRYRIDTRKKSKVYWKSSGKCWYCGEQLTEEQIYDDNGKAISSISRWHVDHIFPLSKGGGYEIENLAPACISCNSSKSDMTLDEFRKMQGDKVFYFEEKRL